MNERQVTNSCSICDARGLTVRQAFALAGFPVPEGKAIQLFDSDGDIRWGHMDVYICGDSPWYLKAEESAPGGWMWWPEQFDCDAVLDGLDLANLPARDALSALPQVVRAAVEGAKSASQPNTPGARDSGGGEE